MLNVFCFVIIKSLINYHWFTISHSPYFDHLSVYNLVWLNIMTTFKFFLGAALNGGLLITFLNFTITQDSLYPYFIFSGLWGMADGIWLTQLNGKKLHFCYLFNHIRLIIRNHKECWNFLLINVHLFNYSLILPLQKTCFCKCFR